MAGITIKNPGSGDQAAVTRANQLLVQSENLSLQHWVSRFEENAYQAEFFDTGIGNGTNVVAFLQNTSPTRKMVITFMRLQAVDLAGGTAIPSANTYFELGFDQTYTSGGSAVTPVNMNRGTGNTADVLAYDTNPTLAGTFASFDRNYVSDEDQQTYNKEGSVILDTNDSLIVRLVTDHTSGTAYGRITFMLMDFNVIG